MKEIDLRGVPCPTNYVRCKLAIEQLLPNDLMQISLDKGEPEDMVISSLRNEGHKVIVVFEDDSWLQLMVTCSG